MQYLLFETLGLVAAVFFSQCISPFWPGQESVKNSASPETEEVWRGTVGVHPDAQAHVKFGTLLQCFFFPVALFSRNDHTLNYN